MGEEAGDIGVGGVVVAGEQGGAEVGVDEEVLQLGHRQPIGDEHPHRSGEQGIEGRGALGQLREGPVHRLFDIGGNRMGWGILPENVEGQELVDFLRTPDIQVHHALIPVLRVEEAPRNQQP